MNPEAIAACVLARLYRARGVPDPMTEERGLGGLLPVETLSGVSEAARALDAAITQDESLLIIGDYDAAI